MQCKYYGNCKHQNESCKSNTALLKCVYGLNEYCTEKSWENEVLKEENDTLKTEIMAVKSGSDVLKICKLEEENKELKKLLKLAVEDIGKHSFCSMCENLNDNSKCKNVRRLLLITLSGNTLTKQKQNLY